MSAPRTNTPLWMRAFFAPLWVVVVIISVPITLLSYTVFRGHCPNCHRRGLRGKRCREPGLYDGRPFGFSECDYCHYQFHTLPGAPIIHVAPTDAMYVLAL